MDLALAVSAYRRDRGNLPELTLVNMLPEAAPTEPNGVVLQSRPPLIDNNVTSGTDDVVAIFQKDGVLDGDLFTVTQGASSKLFRDGVLVGTITGTGPVSLAGNEIGLAVCAGVDIHFYDGAALNTADFPDGADVCKVLELAGRFIGLRSGTGKFYWTETLSTALVGGILTFGGLAFATAENEPDSLVDAVVVDDRLILGGKETVEFWIKTGDDDLPFSPIDGLVYEKGVKSTGCLVTFDNTFAFISGDGLVYRGGNVPERISDGGIEERLANSNTASLFSWFWEGHEVLSMRLDSETWSMDAQTSTQSPVWFEFESYGLTNWAASCAARGPIFGGPDGMTLVFGEYTDGELGGVLERRFRAGMALNGGSIEVNNLRLRCNPGQAPLLGDYADPVIEMKTSRDAGFSWNTPQPAKLGAQGQYRKRVEWRALGAFDDPGLLVEFRCTDPVPLRISGVTINEASEGRARDA